MKKVMICLAACAAAAACLLTLAACKSSGKSDSSVDSSSSKSIQSASIAAGGLNSDGKYGTVADFVNSEEMQDRLKSMTASMSEGGLTVEMAGQGSTLSMIFTYGEELDEAAAASISTALLAALDQMTDVFEEIAGELKEKVEVDDPQVEVIYKTTDGTELCSRTYSPAE